jgi:hypothetical protein
VESWRSLIGYWAANSSGTGEPICRFLEPSLGIETAEKVAEAVVRLRS